MKGNMISKWQGKKMKNKFEIWERKLRRGTWEKGREGRTEVKKSITENKKYYMRDRDYMDTND